jgi:aryl-alcohol dehydrogenase-like predicted oxidoreductase
MEYKSLGRTGVKVSPICLGTMNFPYRTPEEKAVEIIDQAIDSGINFIDTADFYGQPLNDGAGQGTTELLLGKTIKNKRQRLVIATKFFATVDRTDPNARGGSRRHIIRACEDSLRRLDTDYIDLYQMHRPDPEVPIDETLRALEDLIRSGKVRYIGTSSFAGWQLVEGLWISDRLNLNRFVTEQPRYSLLDRRIETEVIPAAEKFGIGILPYSPLGGGLLTGKYTRDAQPPADSRMQDDAWGQWASGFASDQVYQLTEVLAALAAEKSCTASQLALAWVAQQPAVVSPIIGPRTSAQLEDNLGAMEISLTEEDIERLDQSTIPGKALFSE